MVARVQASGCKALKALLYNARFKDVARFRYTQTYILLYFFLFSEKIVKLYHILVHHLFDSREVKSLKKISNAEAETALSAIVFGPSTTASQCPQ